MPDLLALVLLLSGMKRKSFVVRKNTVSFFALHGVNYPGMIYQGGQPKVAIRLLRTCSDAYTTPPPPPPLDKCSAVVNHIDLGYNSL